MTAAHRDRYWSDGLQVMLSDGAVAGDLRAGVLSTVGLRR